MSAYATNDHASPESGFQPTLSTDDFNDNDDDSASVLSSVVDELLKSNDNGVYMNIAGNENGYALRSKVK